jgi:hypothetical protein
MEKQDQQDAATQRTEIEQQFRLAVREYRRLAWPKTAVEQREHDRLNRELMRLYLELNPKAPYHPWDDFDVVSRGKRMELPRSA